MNKAGFARIVFIVFFVSVVFFVYSVFIDESEAPTPVTTIESVELTVAEALTLLRDEMIGGECLAEGAVEQYRSCRIDMVEQNGVWSVTIVYDGLYDDSVMASKLQTSITRQGEQWVVGESVRSSQCQPGRGQQDFSTELCN